MKTDPVIKATLEAMVGAAKAATWAGPLTAAAELADLSTDKRLEHFLAQTMHETGGLTWLEELWGPTPAQERYEGREDLGNSEPGDGKRFKGRGLLHLTGRYNYRRYAADVGAPIVMEQPELLAQPPHAALSAAWFWDRRGINTFADRDDLEAVTRAVNGGLTHLEHRRAWLERARLALATAQPPERPEAQLERLGAHTPLVLHDLTEADHRALLRAWLDGSRTVVLTGAWLATRTSSGGETDTDTIKLDVRRQPE